MNEVQILRKRVAALALDYCEERITYQQFLDSIHRKSVDDEEDGGAEELVDMITHGSHVGGFFGISRAQGEKDRAEILALIAKLQRE